MAQTSFEDILRIRERLGTKIYRDSVLKKFASKSTIKNYNKKNVDEDIDDDDNKLTFLKFNLNKKKLKGNPNLQFKRSNKSYPIEASSKRLDHRHNFAAFSTIAGTSNRKHKQKYLDPTMNSEFRDPRFENSSQSSFKIDKFEQNYHFLNDMKIKELESLRKQLKKTRKQELQERLSRSIQILHNQVLTTQKKQELKEVAQKVKDKVKNLKELDYPYHNADNKSKSEVKLNKRNQRKTLINKCK